MNRPRSRYTLLVLISTVIILTLAAPVSAKQVLLTQAQPTPQPGAGTGSFSLYLPLIARAPDATYDLSLEGLEITQAIQTPTNVVPMVAGRPAVVRVYAKTDAKTAIGNVYLSLTALRNGVSLPGSPLTFGPGTVPLSWSRGDINSSFNVPLPAEWLTTGPLNLEVKLDPTNAIPETNETNNSQSLALQFQKVPDLSITVVPIQYTDPWTGITFGPASSTFLAPDLMKMYPVGLVSVTRRSQVLAFSQNLHTDLAWNDLLDRVETIKRTDGAPSWRIYYGLVPLEDSHGNSWFSSGIAGLGYVGIRISIGLTDASDLGIDGGNIAAHEIGHNLGREHAPCDVSPSDPHYPYPGGSIGQYGLNLNKLAILSPTVYTDIMGYCSKQWVSDYTYYGLYTDQVARGGPAANSLPPAPGLLVRASLATDGSFSMKPIYRFTAYLDEPVAQSDYSIELLNQNGELVASHVVALHRAEESGLRVQSINAMLPWPDGPFTTIRLLNKGRLVAEKSLLEADAVQAAGSSVQQVGEQLVVRWGASQIPAVVRFTTDAGQTWVTVGVDALGGELTLNAKDLPTGPVQFEILQADTLLPPITLSWQNPR